MATNTAKAADAPLLAQFERVRALSRSLVQGLSDADATAQSMPDTSPAKWHLAHTSWFFETFVLREHAPGYRPFDPRYAYLFNSYYEAEGERQPRDRRGLLTRPSLAEVLEWRAHVDAAVADAFPAMSADAHALIELGCHHEQQHQELLLTDLLHLFAQNPLGPAAFAATPEKPASAPPLLWIEGVGGKAEIGATGPGFAFDCEEPRHNVWLAPYALASRCVTNAEWADFILDGGYQTPSLWLSDGWAWVQKERVEAPLYWRDDEQFTLAGWRPRDPAAPVAHISLYEADAYASWASARLPTEAEWEVAAIGHDASGGNQLDAAQAVAPGPPARSTGLSQLFGDVWEWTGSAYRPYPGFRAAEGAVGEYNGKFMSGQFVLKGASCATPRGSSRASYRNFFYPHQRWQFTGLRLARDV